MRVLFFAQAKDATGAAELEMNVSRSLTTDELWIQLIALKPKLDAYRKTTRLARNGEYTDGQTLFSDSDEVALIPPVSGG